MRGANSAAELARDRQERQQRTKTAKLSALHAGDNLQREATIF